MKRKPDWLFRQSGVVPVWRDGVVLITSRKSKRWVIPKGVVERGMSPVASAAKEAWEEAGVRGGVGSEEVGRYRYDKWGGTCTVRVFRMDVEKLLPDWPEAQVRDRIVVPPAEAIGLLREMDLQEIVRTLCSC